MPISSRYACPHLSGVESQAFAMPKSLEAINVQYRNTRLRSRQIVPNTQRSSSTIILHHWWWSCKSSTPNHILEKYSPSTTRRISTFSSLETEDPTSPKIRATSFITPPSTFVADTMGYNTRWETAFSLYPQEDPERVMHVKVTSNPLVT